MKLKWYGHSCFGLTFANGTTVITDPFDTSVGYPLCTARADIALTSHGHFDHNHVDSLAGEPTVLSTPGTQELNGLRITGVPTFHDDAQGTKRGENVAFVIEGDGLRIAHLGDLGHMPDAEQLAALKNIDLLLIPIGGFFTIDTPTAVEIINQIKPRTAVAMHFSNAYCHFPISNEKQFVALTGAELVDNALEITPETKLPAAIIMRID